ncbi:MAG: LemA family protein [Myxococcales bacterium]|nr:LemA family protein [Myxococcales bacterium]
MSIYSRLIILVAGLFVLAAVPGCGYNRLQGMDEEVNAAWAEVQNQYQRRFDLIPNLVETVKGYAAHEADTLKAVTEARAKVGQTQITPEMLSDPAKFQEFQAAQSGLTQALSRLMVVVEKYPDLKANTNFLDLQSQLEGTENRITVARKRYIDAVKEYNKMVRYFPTNLTAKFILHLKTKETFTVENEAAKQAPKVQF